MADLPARAQVVIVGGGVTGCSVAYHLTKLGCTDVLLLEQGHLSGGTTWPAAGLVGPLRASEGNDLVASAIDEAIGRKPKGHDFVIDRNTKRPAVTRHMSVTGG